MTHDAEVAVVTGAASGIGRATAIRLAAAGLAVGLVDLEGELLTPVAEEIGAAGGRAAVAVADVADERSVESGFAAIAAELGQIGALVNNAGTIVDSAPALDQTWEEWLKIMHVNAGGAFLCSRSVLAGMIERGGGAIVNVASISGLVGIQGQSAYCMSKGAIVQLTRSLTADYAADGIRCNAICPGSIETPLLEKAAAQDPQILDKLRAGHPIGRLGTSEEMAAAIEFMVSTDASFLSGSIVSADGGYVAV